MDGSNKQFNISLNPQLQEFITSIQADRLSHSSKVRVASASAAIRAALIFASKHKTQFCTEIDNGQLTAANIKT